jgi:hypothetical protein
MPDSRSAKIAWDYKPRGRHSVGRPDEGTTGANLTESERAKIDLVLVSGGDGRTHTSHFQKFLFNTSTAPVLLHHAVIINGVEIKFHVFLISELHGGKWSGSRSCHLNPGKEPPGTHSLGDGWVSTGVGVN